MQATEMVETILSSRAPYPWSNYGNAAFTGFAWDGTGRFAEGSKAAGIFSGIFDRRGMQKKILEVEGMYSVVVRLDNGVVLASEATGIFPLFYKRDRERWIVSDDPVALLAGNQIIQRNRAAIYEFISGGYVTGNETLVEGVYRVRPGEAVFLGNDKQVETGEPFIFKPGNRQGPGHETAKRELSGLLDRQARRLIDSLRNKTAVVPLSGGFDSRLIACMLKKAGYRKVVCFTYGRRTRETELSEMVAQALGYPWMFVDYEKIDSSDFQEDSLFRSYCRYSGQMVSMPYLQEYFALKYLAENKMIPDDSVFLPGHPGDNLAGSFIGKGVKGKTGAGNLARHIAKTFFRFIPQSGKAENELEGRVSTLLGTYGTGKDSDGSGFTPEVETWNFCERLPKFIMNSARVFPFFGYEMRMPLWSYEMADFFSGLPYPLRVDKKLYKEVLEEIYFKPLKVHFRGMELQREATVWLPGPLKDLGWKMLPPAILQKKAAKNDWICYKRFTGELVADLKKRGISPIRRYRSLNALVCQWYLECGMD
jgi:asparagine synthase (glutamine-hydrolysing)